MKTLAFLIALITTHLLQARDYYVFVGSYNYKKSKPGIYVYKLDTVSGRLSRIAAINNVLNPAFLEVAPGGSCIYACIEALIPGGGLVGSFAFDSVNGTLTFMNQQKSGGANPVYCSVDKNGRWLVNGNYTGGSASIYPLDANGAIGPAAQILAFSDSSINKERQSNAHIHAAVFAPDQQHIFLPDLGADKIRCFTFDPDKASPLDLATSSVINSTPGSGPRHFTFHPNNRFGYCIEELTGTISVYRYVNETLDAIQRIPAHEGKATDGYHSADIHLSPDGLFLYATNRGTENNIAIFSVDPQSGKLKIVGYQSTMGDHPRSFAIDPTGKYLLVANQESGTIVVFRRDGKTGLLSATGHKAKVPGASCIKIRKYEK